MKKRVLVTGGSGFIGANLIRRLVKQSQDVHILTRLKSTAWRLDSIQEDITKHKVDYTDTRKLKRTVEDINPQVIYHVAGYGGYPFQKDLQTIIATNITYTVNLLTALSNVPYELFIATGSSSEYGYKKKPMKETDATFPVSLYAAAKVGMTHIARTFGSTMKKPVTVVRPFSVYGPYEEPSRLVPTVIAKLLKNDDIALTNGRERRDFIFIEDFLDGLEAISLHSQETKGHIFNLGSGNQHTTSALVETIHTQTGSKSKLLWGTYKNRMWDTKNWQADISKAKRMLGWQPKHSLEEGVRKTIVWFQKHLSLYENKT